MRTCANCGTSNGPFVSFGVPNVKVCGSKKSAEYSKIRLEECLAKREAQDKGKK